MPRPVPDGGSSNSGPDPSVLFVRDAASFWQLVDAFIYSSTDVFNAQQDFRAAAGNAGDAFGNGNADRSYQDSFNAMMQALQNLQNAYETLGEHVNTAGVALTSTDAAIRQSFEP